MELFTGLEFSSVHWLLCSMVECIFRAISAQLLCNDKIFIHRATHKPIPDEWTEKAATQRSLHFICAYLILNSFSFACSQYATGCFNTPCVLWACDTRAHSHISIRVCRFFSSFLLSSSLCTRPTEECFRHLSLVSHLSTILLFKRLNTKSKKKKSKQVANG